MQRFIVFATAVLFLASLAGAVPGAQAGGRYRRGAFFFENAWLGGYPATNRISVTVGGGSPGVTFLISSGTPGRYGWGLFAHGKHFRDFRDHRFHDRRGYGRHGHKGFYLSRGGLAPRLRAAPSSPVTRFWVPGRMTPRGYVRGYWEYR